MTENSRLTPKQRRAIAALLSCPTIVEAAQLAECGERTLYTWLDDPAFRTELRAAEDAVVDTAVRALATAGGKAVSALADLVENGNAPVRLKAADAILNHLLKLRELRNLEGRITELERLYGANN